MLKKLILVTVLLSTATFALVAETTTSPLYYKILPIVKIYPMLQGYRVVYLSPVGTPHNAYIPMSWFGTGTSKAVLIAGNKPSYPYMAVFWDNGKFDYVKLYVKSDPSDPSWGEVPQGASANGKFPTDGSLTIQWN